MAKQKSPQVQKEYYAYLLRMWLEFNGEEISTANERIWRASLQCPGSSKRIGFSSLETLFDFLSSQAGIDPSSGNQTED